jgi:thiol-disulfide isomerase/thioredoxin
MLSRLKNLAITTLFVATAATGTTAFAGSPKSGVTAPEFTGIHKWLNSDPLTMQQLRGQVVLVDFWTYTCINCINTLPYVKSWNQKYKDQGLAVIGVHTPEYPFERDTDNVKTAIKRFGITYPVAQDNQYATWSVYNNQYWPAVYLIDKKGQVVYSHFGEGNYAETEAKIQALLA